MAHPVTRRGVLNVQIFQPLSKAFLERDRAGGFCASRWLNSFHLKEKRVDINPSIATDTEYFLGIKGSVDFFFFF